MSVSHEEGGDMKQPSHRRTEFVRSREELLKVESEYYQDLCEQVLGKRRTKIAATINQQNYKNYEQVARLVAAGVNQLVVNMAYCSTEFVGKLSTWRTALENDLDIVLPITCVLKGNLPRIGELQTPEVFLNKGQQYRVMLKKRIVGDKHICSVDDEELLDMCQVGAKLVVDQGQVGLTVIGREKSDETLIYLQKFCGYGRDFAVQMSDRRRKTATFISSSGSVSNSSPSSEKEITVSPSSFTRTHRRSGTQKVPATTAHHLFEPSIESTNVFAERLSRLQKTKLKTTYDVILCTADSDCIIKPYKPVFIYKQNTPAEGNRTEVLHKKEGEEETEERISLSPKDLKDLLNALNHEVDNICVSNVRCAEDILDVKKHFSAGKSTTTPKIFAKIQNLEGVRDFKKILGVSDGMVIARGYLTLYIPVEKLLFLQRQMIETCHSHMKPVLIQCSILESMVSSQLPRSCEVGDIAVLVASGVDEIILSGETSYGSFAVQAVETLARICIESEAREVRASAHHTRILQHPCNSSVSDAIILATIQAAYNIKASLIIVFTSTGSTAIRLSKHRPPCQIIAVTASTAVARFINCLASVTARVFPSLLGTSKLLDMVIAEARRKKQLRKGDFIVITSGAVDNLSGTTNNLNVIQVA